MQQDMAEYIFEIVCSAKSPQTGDVTMDVCSQYAWSIELLCWRCFRRVCIYNCILFENEGKRFKVLALNVIILIAQLHVPV